mgnify:CR=1 FL=1|jgi:hypothetical protein
MNGELINVTLYDPTNALFGNKQDKAEATFFYCSNKDQCDYYKNGQCLNVANVFKGSCSYGTKSCKQGYTRRARSFHKWIRDIRDNNEDLMWALSRAPDVISGVGEYMCLPYSHMTLDNDLFVQKSHLFSGGIPFIPKEQWNIESAYSLITRRPQAMMGGEIKSYQKEVVPKFCKDLQDQYPEFYQDLISKYPQVAERTDSYSYVGRKALISSLKPGTKIRKKKEVWVWDGAYLTSTNHEILFSIVKYDEISVRIKPEEGESVKIENDDQVDSDTKFLD